LVKRPVPEPGAGEVVIHVEAAGVGLVDVLQRQGHLGAAAAGFIPGLEVAGQVAAVGVGVDADLIGKRVFAWGQGGYAERFLAKASALVELPRDLSPEAAVALGINALVAQFSHERARVQSGERVLVRGASGGIGAMAAQLAVLAGAEVTALTNAQAAEGVAGLGVQHVVRRGVDETPPGPFDVIIDPVAGEAMLALVDTLAPNGRYIVNGAAAGLPPAGMAEAMLQRFPRSLTYGLFSLDSVSDELRAKSMSRLMERAAAGELRPVIAEILPLGDAAKAHKLLEAGRSFGKVVLKPHG
jgi:NADPH2:quinone reductase